MRCLGGLVLAGAASVAAGLAWNPWFPINKNLWTSSYVLYAAGWSLLLLALCTWLVDIRRMNQRPAGRAVLWPWLVFGSNAITAFVLSNFIVEAMLWIKVPAGGMGGAAAINTAAPASSISFAKRNRGTYAREPGFSTRSSNTRSQIDTRSARHWPWRGCYENSEVSG